MDVGFSETARIRRLSLLCTAWPARPVPLGEVTDLFEARDAVDADEDSRNLRSPAAAASPREASRLRISLGMPGRALAALGRPDPRVRVLA